jgi:hypothetical protein
MKLVLPWSLRQKVFADARENFTRHGKSNTLATTLFSSLRIRARSSKSPALQALVEHGVVGRSLEAVLEGWVAEMPATRRADWLVDRLAAAGGFDWAAEPPLPSGPLTLPRAERDQIQRRFERVWERSIDRFDDPPETEAYADALDDELERIGATNEDLAVRVLTKRFFDDHGERTLTFHQALVRSKLADADAILQFLEKKLEIEWTSPPVVASPVERPLRPYAMDASYEVGDHVDHPKFGRGTVIATSPGKVQIRFDTGVRTLSATAG